MNRIVVLYALLIWTDLSGVVKADTSSPSEFQYPPPEYASLKPSLAVVIGILTIMFVLTFLLLVYAKFCHRPREPEHINRGRNNNNNLIINNNPSALISSSDRFSGIDKTVIESLPFFRFSALKGSRQGLECAVCLSRFEDVEILRLLPKCRHAFHIDCIDFWLERHSTCPLCRHRVSSEDLKLIAYSNSMRFLRDDDRDSSRLDEEVELFVQREESRRGSSRFSVGSSFRKIEKSGGDDQNDKEEIVLMSEEGQREVLDKHKHRIIVSEFAMKNRWSNLNSSDLMFLNSEMLIDEANNSSSGRLFFSSSSSEVVSGSKRGNEEIIKIKEEMEMKKAFETKVGAINTKSNANVNVNSSESSVLSGCGERRSVSEITAVSRHGNRNRLGPRNGEKEERVRRVWLPIARRTVQWFANRQERSHFQQQNQQRQSLDV